MSLASTAVAFKKIVIPLFVLALIIALMVLAYLKLFSRQKPLTPLENISIQALPQEVSIVNSTNLKTQNQPTSLFVYNITGQENLLQKSNTLVNKLNLKNAKSIKIKDTFNGDGEAYGGQNGSLAVYSQLITFQQIGTKPHGGNFDSEKLKAKSLQLLEDLELNSNIGDPQVEYQTFDGAYAQKATGPNIADLINFDYNNKIDGIPIVGPLSGPSVSLTSEGTLFTLKYTPLPQFSIIEKYPLINPNDAVEALKKRKTAAIKITPFPDTIASTKTFTSVDLKSAFLAYYLSPNQATVQPVWVLEGNGQISGSSVDVQFAIPAVKPQFYKNTTKP